MNTAILFASSALITGMLSQMKGNVTNTTIGDVQIHHPGYRDEPSLYRIVHNADAIMDVADKLEIKAVPRRYGFGLVALGTKSAGAQFRGVDPLRERQTFVLSTKMYRGEFLGDKAEGQVVLGYKLAKSLHADIGAELVALVQAADGSMGNELFVVGGIVQPVAEDIDRSGLFLHQLDFDRLFLSEGLVHEIAFSAGGSMSPKALKQKLTGALKGVVEIVDTTTVAAGDSYSDSAEDTKIEMLTWAEIMPTFADLLKVSEASTFLFVLIFFLAAGLGVMNTMLMATYDRVREYGVLKALGATPLRIIVDVATEAWVLALLSTAIGAVIGGIMVAYLQIVGLDLRSYIESMSVGGVAYDPIWRAEFQFSDLLVAVVGMWVVCVLAALYPAFKAGSLRAVRAMTHY